MHGTMPKKKPPGGGEGKPPDRHKLQVSSFRPPQDIRQAIEDLAREQRRTFSQMLLLVVEAGLTSLGRMPPREEDA